MKLLKKTPAQADRIAGQLQDIPAPSSDAQPPCALLRRCPVADRTPLHRSQTLAKSAQVAEVYLKDERNRMGLGSFKALGAAHVIARDAETGQARGRTYVTASAGNHGLSVAAGAQAFGATAVIYLADTVPSEFAARLQSFGAKIVRHGAIYEDSMQAAADAANSNGWALLSDSSWTGYTDRPYRLMQGYLILMKEAAEDMDKAPTHIFLQAGVGGLAAACASYARKVWGNDPTIIVVEPERAPALFASMEAGDAILSQGASSHMGRLDCKEPSLIALKGLAHDADAFLLISEDEGAAGATACAEAGYPSTTSGAAGIAGMLACSAIHDQLGMGTSSRVLAILSEAAT